MSRYSQRGFVGPRVDDRAVDYFPDWYSFDKGDVDKKYPQKKFVESDRNTDIIYSGGYETGTALSDPFMWNQRSVVDFFKNLDQSPLYKGLMESIGRVTVYIAKYIDSPFARYFKDPLQHGNAVMSGMFKDIPSREWNYVGAGVGKGKLTPSGEYTPQEYDSIPCEKEPLFDTKAPEFVGSVSRMNFSRELALRFTEHDFSMHSTVAEMVGQISAALMAKSHQVYMNDMYEAARQYFCGVVRSSIEPSTDVDYGTASSTSDNPDFIDDPMLECVIVDCDEKDVDKRGAQIADQMSRIIHNTSQVDFMYPSTKYNPSGVNVMSGDVDIIMDKHYQFDIEKRYYAQTYNPEYIKPPKNVDFGWIDEFPPLGTAIYANEENKIPIEVGNKEWIGYFKLIAMIVDHDAPAIIPYKTPVSVQSWFNPQQESLNFYTHYRCIYEFKPFFNRKYVYALYLEDAGKVDVESKKDVKARVSEFMKTYKEKKEDKGLGSVKKAEVNIEENIKEEEKEVIMEEKEAEIK